MAGTQSLLAAARQELAELENNPLTGYFLTCQRRLARRQGFVQRNAAWIFVTGVAAVCIPAYYIINRNETYPVTGLEIIAILLLAFLVGSALFYLQALSAMVAACLCLTGSGEAVRGKALPQLDDQISVLPLSAADILRAALRMLLPPMLLPTLIANFAFFLYYFSSTSETSGAVMARVIQLFFISSICGLLAVPLCALFFIAVGGGMSQLWAVLAARVFAFLQCLWLPLAISLNEGFTHTIWHYNRGERHGYQQVGLDPLAISALLLGMLLAALLFCLQPFAKPVLLRRIVAGAGPFIPALALAVFFLAGTILLETGGDLHFSYGYDLLSKTISGLTVAQGTVFPLNPILYSLPFEFIGTGFSHSRDSIFEVDPSFAFRAAVTPLLQLAMLPFFWRAALRNIHRMRQAR